MTHQYDRTESDNNSGNHTNVLLALLAGASAGIAVGILMAPKAGDRLRAEIGQAVNGYLDAARESADQAMGKARAKLSDAVETGAKSAHHAIDQTVAAVNSGARRGHQAVDDAAETGSKTAHNAIDQTLSAVNSGARRSHQAVDTAAATAHTRTGA